MNRAITTTMAIAAAFAFTAASSAQQPTAQQPPRPTQNPPPAMHSSNEAKSADDTFVMKMANGGMAEVELGKLAVKNSGRQDVNHAA
jgi:predicted outer membrane protein